MARYKLNVVWEAEIELDLNTDDPQKDYQSYSWDELFNEMKNAGIHENVRCTLMRE